VLTVTNSTFSGNSASKGGVYHTMNNHPMLKGDILANSTGKNCGALKTDRQRLQYFRRRRMQLQWHQR